MIGFVEEKMDLGQGGKKHKQSVHIFTLLYCIIYYNYTTTHPIHGWDNVFLFWGKPTLDRMLQLNLVIIN